MNADPSVMQFFPSMLNTAQSDLFAETMQIGLEQKKYGLWAVELKDTNGAQDGTFIGFVGLSEPSWKAPFTPCIEIGWRLARTHWGFGYATEAATEVLAYSFGLLELAEIVSFTALLNTRSLAVMERLGMFREVSEDFDHPLIEPGDTLGPHALYRISSEEWAAQRHS
ncbi:MAG: RimJ/RimL family protein N-acetyltransferase [Candidatus Poriferisodalaceae bacterium]|jgi:RimJ/RimL family protein N-acetyltransferase|tara:strand:- start:4278 stop:4781 length:504 start_codon:yes stop_codon:yes gene_type:complete